MARTGFNNDWVDSWRSDKHDRSQCLALFPMGRENGVKDWMADCLRKPKTGHHEGERRKGTTLRVIELNSVYGDGHREQLRLGSVKVEEYEVQGFDSKGP